MVTVTRIQAGQYTVSDGRFIVKDGSAWYVISEEGKHDFGPVPTLAAAKEYVKTGTIPVGQHNFGSTYGRRQSKKEYNAYLAAEAKKGNYGPLVLQIVLVCGFLLLIYLIRGY